MITIELNDYRGCASARVECNPIALVAGRNAAGKSSLAQGVGACLCGKLPAPAGGPRNLGGLLVRTGAGSASISVRSDDGVARIIWPSGQGSAEGHAPTASEWAAGLDSIVYLSARDRARVLSDVLHAAPTQDDLDEAMAAAGVTGKSAQIWKQIEGHGWDGAHAGWKDQGAMLKGQWQQVTGVRYGSRVGASWRPDLAGLDEAEIAGAVQRAQAGRDRAIAAEAVSEAERRRIEEEADLLDDRRKALAEAERSVADAEKVYAAMRDARAALPPAELAHTVPCPYCSEPIVVERDVVEVRLLRATGKRTDEHDARSRRHAIAEAEGKMANASDRLNIARKDAAGRAALVEASERYAERLANWPRAVEHTITRAEAEEVVAAAQKRLRECQAKIKADDIHDQIEAGERIIELLAGDGLRRDKLGRVLAAFEGSMKQLSDEAGWSPVSITLDTGLLYGDRPYFLLSASEQFRVRVVLQLAMAQIEGASLVVIDGADILDGPARSGLIAMLSACGIPALVCMTLSRIELMPDLAEAELGSSYWIEAGVIDRPAAKAA